MTCRYAIGCTQPAIGEAKAGIPICRQCTVQASVPSATPGTRPEPSRTGRCACGCGRKVTGKWAQGHNMRGVH